TGRDRMELAKNLKKHIEKKEVEYTIVDEIKRDLKGAEKKAERLNRQNRSFQEQIEKLESQKIALKAESEVYHKQIRQLKRQYQEAVSTNKKLERKLSDVPKKFAEIARENRLLIKETALMHYNLGVFYTEERQYGRAVAEFEKAIELNPDDAYAYFNLGYLYAEHLIDRAKAIKNFRQYLRRAGKNEKEVDWVKRYILTWQAWEEEKPIR
ncbi:MAG: tetratricopeptide repeat protein, partial [Candidatus Omnitrophota bacterium]